MGRVWLKTKYDSGMNMEIPHSHNMSNGQDLISNKNFMEKCYGI